MMEDHSEASFVRDLTHELDAIHVAFLLDASKADELERVTGDLGSRWERRVELRVLGPMAPYDFVESLKNLRVGMDPGPGKRLEGR